MPPLILCLPLLLDSVLLLVIGIDKRLSSDVLHEARLPDQMDAVAVLKLVEDSIAANHNEVLLVALNAKGSNIWVGHDNPGVAVKSVKFCLDITKSAADRKSSRENSMRPQNDLALDTSWLLDIDN